MREGEAQRDARRPASQQVLPGQTAIVTASRHEAPVIRNGGGIDGFDTWSAARDRVYERAAAATITSRGRWSGMRISTRTARGNRTPTTAPCGFPTVAAGLGAVSRRLLDVASRLGLHVGRSRRRGATRRSTTVAGRTSAGAGAGVPARYVARPLWAPALVAWYGGADWAVAGDGARLRLGAARLARAVRPVVAPLLGPLLGALQPALCGQRRRASRRAADALCELARAGRPYRGARCHARWQARPSRPIAIAVPLAMLRRRCARPPAVKPATPVRPAVRSRPVRCRHRRRRSTSLAHRLRPLQRRSRGALAPAAPMADGAGGLPATPSVRGAGTGGGARGRCAGSRAATHRRRRITSLQRLVVCTDGTAALPSGRSARRRCLRGRRRCRSHPRRQRPSRPRRCCRRLSQRRRCRMSSHQPALRRREPPSSLPTPVPPPSGGRRRRRLRRRQRPPQPVAPAGAPRGVPARAAPPQSGTERPAELGVERRTRDGAAAQGRAGADANPRRCRVRGSST